ncbi:MAG TPA: phytanoyl-CoA dioxygenase family protein [Ramlibacter sp.]|nr:phytanoyl-CoA dioxygenase family protein [Ramlibacter sp.]
MHVGQIPDLIDSTGSIGDPQTLRERWDNNGYLFFRGVIDPHVIASARVHFRRALAAEGLIDPAVDAPIWTGAPAKTRRPCDAIGEGVFREVTAQPRLEKLVADVLGDKPVWLPIIAHRSSLPSGRANATDDIFKGRHQDGYFNEGMDIDICWVPMMDISRANGGLAVAAGQHKRGYLHDGATPPRYPIPTDAIPPGTWRTADFRVGDVLLFHRATPHTGLPNQTDVIRMSMDFRFCSESSPKPIMGTVTKLDGAAVRIHTDGKDVDIVVDDETFIRRMDPFPRLRIDQLKEVAHEGAKVIAMVDKDHKVTVLRPNFY